MNKLKAVLPHLVAVIVFVIITAAYFSPLFKGKEIKQQDIMNHQGMSQEIVDFRNEFNEEPLWTNSMFGGMPAYQISVKYPSSLVSKADKILTIGLPRIAGYVFLYIICFYILMLVLKVDPWLGIVGSIAFGFSSYFFIIIEAGHNSKAHAIAYMPAVLAGIILTFRKKYVLGGALTGLFLALELYANHLQITYYLALLIGIFGICELVCLVKSKDTKHFLTSAGVLIAAIILAVGSNITNLWATYDYGKYTTRGKTELTINVDKTSNEANITSGLDKDYATQWSYGVGESMSLMIPNFKGGSSGPLLYDELVKANQGKGKERKAAAEKLEAYDQSFIQYIIERLQGGGYINQYWGDQPFTSGPVYVGAGVIFLFILGLFVVKGGLKWVLFAGTILSIVLAWGKNFMPVTEFFLEYFPGYNKFRAVSMILVLAELTIPVLAILGLSKLISDKELLEDKIKLPFISKPIARKNTIWIAFALSGGVSLLYFLMPGTLTDFYIANEHKSIDPAFIESVSEARIGILKADAMRSFLIITIVFALVWSYMKFSYNKALLFLGLGLVFIVDLWNVNKRYLNDENFVKKTEAKVPFQATKADSFILKDTDPNYRVLNIAVSTFNDASTSYFHKSIGGYHGAKLKRYQELIEFHISNDMQEVMNTLRTMPTDSAIKQSFAKQGVLNMLNTRYLIYSPDAAPIRNHSALGNAWFVNEIKWVANADSEIVSLGNFDPAKTVIIDERFKSEIKEFNPAANSNIRLTDYKANHLTYESNASAEQLAVFSEIYFANGWNAYIDGNTVPHVRANYVLRAMNVPSGKHTIEFRFEPKIYSTGEGIALVSSSVLILVVVGGLALGIKKTISS